MSSILSAYSSPWKKKTPQVSSIFTPLKLGVSSAQPALQTNGFTSSKPTSPYIYPKTNISDSSGKSYLNQGTSSYTAKPIQTLSNGQIKYDNNSVTGFPGGIPSTPDNKNLPPPSNPTDSYLGNISNLSKESIQLLKDKSTSDQDFYDKLYGQKNQALSNQIPFLQKNFAQFKSDTEGSINDATAGAGQVEVGAETQWGGDQRALAQTRRESEGRNNSKYALLNTTDSYGEGSYGRAQENVESDFNRQTATGLQGLENKKFQIGQELSAFVRQAKSYIINEQTKLNAKLQEISDNMGLNDSEKLMLKKQANDEYQSGILGIKQNLVNLKYEYAQSDTSNLSAEFLKTGVPTSAKEFEFLQKNKDAFTNIGSNSASAQKQPLIDLIDKIAGGEVGAITGVVRTGWLPGSKGAMTQNYYNQLKGMLSLENRSKLKGSGAISDFESRTLEKAASALGQNLSEDQFKLVLNDLKSSLGGQGTTNQMISVKLRSSGQTGTIPASEFDSSLYEQI